MSHQANPDFWKFYHRFPVHIQQLADQNFALLKQDARHPSLRLKKIGRKFTCRKLLIRFISARDMSRKERKVYEPS